MTLNEYQNQAASTDPTEIQKGADLSVLLFGIAGETGSLLTLYKKWLRDGDAYQIVDERLVEELGDILWYLAAIARRRGVTLERIAAANLEKTSSRWSISGTEPLFDEGRDIAETLPRSFTADLVDELDSQGRPVMAMSFNGVPLGSTLTDNSHGADGYRFHDLLHLSLAAHLGWSPVIRALLKKKRKSSAILDEVEDGGRAIAIEEGIAALVFSYAAQHSMLGGVTTLDWGVLRTCSIMASGLEVRAKTLYAWEVAILSAFAAWREALLHGGVRVHGDLNARTFTVERIGQN